MAHVASGCSQTRHTKVRSLWLNEPNVWYLRIHYPPWKWMIGTRWAPTSYKWSCNPYKWSYKWVTGAIAPISGVITLLITSRGPPWRLLDPFGARPIFRCECYVSFREGNPAENSTRNDVHIYIYEKVYCGFPCRSRWHENGKSFDVCVCATKPTRITWKQLFQQFHAYLVYNYIDDTLAKGVGNKLATIVFPHW